MLPPNIKAFLDEDLAALLSEEPKVGIPKTSSKSTVSYEQLELDLSLASNDNPDVVQDNISEDVVEQDGLEQDGLEQEEPEKELVTLTEPVVTETYRDSADVLPINIELNDEFELKNGPMLAGKFMLRVPIAVLGSWQHPQYGEVEFTSEDFADMIRNFESNVSGFEPPLFYGHPIEAEAPGSAPAVGFLATLYQEDDVLFGEFEVKSEAYSQVRDEYYRYSSAEVIRNAVSKESGEQIGTLLVGCALTNRPFLTRMPKVKALTETFSSWTERSTHFLIPLAKTGDFRHNMADPMKDQAQSPASPVEQESVTPQVSAPVGQHLAEQLLNLAKEVETQRQITEQAKQAADRANQELYAQKLAAKITRLESLNLSDSVKAAFKPMLEAGLAENQETEIFAALTELSDQHTKVLLSQQGSQTDSTSEQNGEDSNRQEYSDNPYMRIITRNQKAAEQRRPAQLF